MTKKVNKRGGFTSVCAHSQVKAATTEFGPIGVGWGYSCEYEFLPDMVICLVTIWHSGDRNKKFGPIAGAKQRKEGIDNSDAPKSAMTDGLTKGLSQLGFNADIFLGKFDDNKYVQEMEQEFGTKAPDGSQSNTSDDNKPWYNDFDKDKANMIENIQNGNATHDKIITKLSKTYKINKKVREQIKAL